jgi:hypothetical protein
MEQNHQIPGPVPVGRVKPLEPDAVAAIHQDFPALPEQGPGTLANQGAPQFDGRCDGLEVPVSKQSGWFEYVHFEFIPLSASVNN